MLSGVSGEKTVGAILSQLPDGFRVINDVTAEAGNLDHVVVGPTGVFVIETKNIRGTIEPDGAGELTLDGKPAETPHVKRLVGRMMGMKKKISLLSPASEPVFFKAVIVFTSARVKARYGTTGKADCIRENRLRDYIVDQKTSRKLSSADIEDISRAFASLARKDLGFSSDEEQVESQSKH